MSSVARITNISARSETRFEDAVRAGVDRANQTLRNVSGAWIKDQKVEFLDVPSAGGPLSRFRDGRIVAYHVAMEVTFVLDD